MVKLGYEVNISNELVDDNHRQGAIGDAKDQIMIANQQAQQQQAKQQAQQAQFEANRNQGTRGKSGGGGNYQKKSNNFQIAKEMGVSPQTVEHAIQNMPDRLAEVFAKLRSGQSLDEEEIMLLAGHSSSSMTNAYFGDRN